MPAYKFRLPANATNRTVTVYSVADNGVRTQVGTGTTDANAVYATTLAVGNYVASVRIGGYSYESSEELATQPPPEGAAGGAVDNGDGTFTLPA